MQEPIEKFYEELNKFDWGTEKEEIILEKQHICKVLQKYLNREIKEYDVENWANIIECRDDIGINISDKNLINEIMHELANPELTTQLSKERTVELVINLLKVNDYSHF